MRGSHAFRLAAITVVLIMAPWAAHADGFDIDFEAPNYSLGLVHGQDNWSSSGSAGSGCAVYDVEVADASTSGHTSFGDQSLRISNAVTSGCFGDQTFSPSVANEAGETGATNGGMSGGTRRRHFSASWEFASTTPGEYQEGLSVVASPDRGDGARMSWVQMMDTPDGLAVNFFGYDTTLGGTCFDLTNFVFTEVATGLDSRRAHSIRIDMYFADGINNDIVHLSVDDQLVHVGKSWEDFFRNCQPPGSRTVDSLLFRVAGTPAPGTDGLGFLIDNLSIDTGKLPTTLTASPAVIDGGSIHLVRLAAELTSPFGAVPGQTISFSSGGTTVCTAVTDADGVAACSGLSSALDVVLSGGYEATYAGNTDHEPAQASAGLIG